MSTRSTLSSTARTVRDWLCRLQGSRDPRALIAEVRGRGLTYLSQSKLESIARECQAAGHRNTGARFIEAGCALGGSTVVIANLLAPRAELFVHDTFQGMPPPTERDSEDVHARYKVIASGQSVGINGSTYYGYRNDLEQAVRSTISEMVPARKAGRVHLRKGLVQDQLTSGAPVAFAHVDVDWYDPVLCCAERIFPDLELGGSIIFDDYLDYQSCRRAVDDYFAPFRHLVSMDVSAGSCRVTRTAH